MLKKIYNDDQTGIIEECFKSQEKRLFKRSLVNYSEISYNSQVNMFSQ